MKEGCSYKTIRSRKRKGTIKILVDQLKIYGRGGTGFTDEPKYKL